MPVMEPDGRQPDRQVEAEALSRLLERSSSILEVCLDSGSLLLERLSRLRERLAHRRLQVAVLGQFKRGKSSFLNALLGAPLLPSSVVPVTAVPTFIAWGAAPSVCISFVAQRPPEQHAAEDARSIQDLLFRFVAEQANPHNQLGVARAEVFYPAPILSDGTVLIDTPGVGSTLKHNTDAALRVLPECDAAVFVVATDPPMTEVELEYLEQVRSKASRIFLVVNKMDTLDVEERSVLVDFFRTTLQECSLLSGEAAIFQVSARDGLAAKLGGDRSGLERSGIKDVEDRLLHFLATEKSASLEQAIAGKAADILGQAAGQVELRVEALRMPLNELEAKTSAFKATLGRIEEQRRVTGDLLMGDKRRLVEKLERRIDELRGEVRKQIVGVIDRSLADADPSSWERTARSEISGLIEEAFDSARERLTCQSAAEADTVLSAYQTRIDELIAEIRHAAAELFQLSIEKDVDGGSFALGEEPYWVTETVATRLIPDPGGMIDRLLPSMLRRKRVAARLIRDADALIIRNAENLRWATLRGFEETFRSATSHLEEQLDDALSATQKVLNQALADRHDKSFAFEPEILRLQDALDSLLELRASLVRSIPSPTQHANACLARRLRENKVV